MIYGLLGWCLEVFWTGAGSMLKGDVKLTSQTYIWMFFIYGSALFLEPIHDIIKRWRWPIRGFLWVVIIWGIEYTSGFFLKTIGCRRLKVFLHI